MFTTSTRKTCDAVMLMYPKYIGVLFFREQDGLFRPSPFEQSNHQQSFTTAVFRHPIRLPLLPISLQRLGIKPLTLSIFTTYATAENLK